MSHHSGPVESWRSRRPASDHENKRRALWRLRRAASSGLPMQSFIQVSFDLISDAIPNSPNKLIMPFADPTYQAYVSNNDEISRWRAPYKHFIIDSPPSVSGRRFELDAARLTVRPVWNHEQMMLPKFHQSAGYNEVFRNLGYHHVIGGIMTEGGEWRGWIPIWRSADMKQFTRDDVAFVEAALPHLTHGLGAARQLESTSGGDDFIAAEENRIGVVLTNNRGAVVGIDEIAKSTFQEIALLEGNPAWIDGGTLRAGFEYVARSLREIFAGPDAAPWLALPPTTAIHCHKSGIAIRLRAIVTDGYDGERAVTVLVERGATRQLRRDQLMQRYGLSQREFELLEMTAAALYPREIAARMGIGIGTLKSYLQRLNDKLGLDGTASLRDFARNLRL